MMCAFQVQAEALRVELKEKQNLLCEAATALELMEQSQKSREDACQSTIEELNGKIEFLEVGPVCLCKMLMVAIPYIIFLSKF